MKKLQRQNGTGGKRDESETRGATVRVRVSTATRDALYPVAEAEGVSIGEILDRLTEANKPLPTTTDVNAQ